MLDLKRNGEILRFYEFPEEVAATGANYLNKIVIDDAFGGFAYITDNSGADPGIIVYSKRLNRSWKVREPNSMRASRNAQEFVVNGTSLNFAIHIDGIALGPYYNPDTKQVPSQLLPIDGNRPLPLGNPPLGGPPLGGPPLGAPPFNSPQNNFERNVYYSPLSSYHLYSIPASVLRDPEFSRRASPRDVLAAVTDVGVKVSQSDGMIMDNRGNLYYSLLKDNAIAQWNSFTPFSYDNQLIIAKDDNYIQWVDGMSFDEDGYLYVVVNRLYNFVGGRLQPNEVNFRILRAKTGALSYVYTNNDGLGARSPDDLLNRGPVVYNDGFGNGIASTTPFFSSLEGIRFFSGASILSKSHILTFVLATIALFGALNFTI